MHRHHGHTLMELVTVVAAAGALAATVLPGLGDLLLDQRELTRANALLGSLHQARTEAVMQGRPATVCASADRLDCGGSFGDGWIVFADDDGDGTRDRDEALLGTDPGLPPVEVVTSRVRFTFRALGRRATNGTVTFCHPAGRARSRAVVVSPVGRPRVSRELPGGKRLPC